MASGAGRVGHQSGRVGVAQHWAALGRGQIIMGSNIAGPPASSPAPDLEQNPDTKKWAAISDRPM